MEETLNTNRNPTNANIVGAGNFNRSLKVLVACEYSGTVRDAFTRLGHNAMSCDLLPTDMPGQHYQGDVRDLLVQKWDLIIAHPPCTRLCNSGVRWLAERNLWAEMKEGAEFFKMFIGAGDRVCIENPIMHKYALNIIGKKHSQTIQPYEFGHTTSKRTCLWLNGLPELKPTKLIPKEERTFDIHNASPGGDRWKIRSTTFKGIADAMAMQWGGFACT